MGQKRLGASVKVIYSTASHLGGTGLSNVAFHAGRALYHDGSLERLVTYKNKQNEIPIELIKRVRFQPAKVFSGLSSRYYYSMKRMWLDWRVSGFLKRHQCDIFHGWTHESLRSIKVAKAAGAITIVDRGYAHPLYSHRILEEEYRIYGIPRNVEEPPTWLRPFDHWRREKEEAIQEFDEADYVFVPSDFCLESFVHEGFPREKLVMIPRGFDPSIYQSKPKPDDTFRVVFVGLLTVRKGLKYLLEAWEDLALQNAELLFVGTLHEELNDFMAPYLERDDVRHVSFTPDPVDLYNSADVFVFPSLDEGSAKVTYEAMACGLPVITTPNSGSLVRDGEDGFIVPIREVEPLKEKIGLYYNHRELAVEMGKTAREYISAFTWDRYEKSLIDTYEELLEQR